MQFTTHLNDDLEKPVFKKGAAFVFKFRAVTSESESKVRVFSPFLKMPLINITNAINMINAFQTAPRSIGGMYINTNCKFTDVNDTYDLLLQQLVTRVNFLQTEMAAAQQEQNTLLEVVNSFIPPAVRQSDDIARPRRAIAAIAAVAAGAGMVLGEPIKDAACSAPSIFNLCHTNEDLSRDVERIMNTQQEIVDTLQGVQTRNDKNFFLLGNEIKQTQKVSRN